MPQREPQAPVIGQVQAVDRHRRTQYVAAHALQPLALPGRHDETGVQAQAVRARGVRVGDQPLGLCRREDVPQSRGTATRAWRRADALHRRGGQSREQRPGIYQRQNPEYSDEVETVEIWEKVDEGTIEVDLWVYDPPVLTEPWYTKHRFFKLSDHSALIPDDAVDTNPAPDEMSDPRSRCEALDRCQVHI